MIIMKNRFRHLIQLVATVLCNGYIIGFQKHRIFQGASKAFCVPVLNCYSCPGALGSCPIGSLQAVLGDRNHHFSFYVLGMLMLFAILLGRLVCGFLCPFGFFQELLYKIPVPKISVPKAADKVLRYLKYLILLFFVIIGPLALTNEFGIGSPYFCKLICPAGTMGGGIPLVFTNPVLQKTIGNLFFWKIGVLIFFVLASLFIYRPFCKYICPLGAFYALFNRFSFYQLKVDHSKCTNCGACSRVCDMQVQLTENKGISECIRCGKCKKVCPQNAIQTEICGKKCGGKRQRTNKNKLEEKI